MTKDDALRMMLGPFKAWRDVPGNEDVVEELTKIINAVEKVLAQPEPKTDKEAIAALKERLADPMRDVQRLGQEIECPECKAEVLYECVACSSNNYPPKENT